MVFEFFERTTVSTKRHSAVINFFIKAQKENYIPFYSTDSVCSCISFNCVIHHCNVFNFRYKRSDANECNKSLS